MPPTHLSLENSALQPTHQSSSWYGVSSSQHSIAKGPFGPVSKICIESYLNRFFPLDPFSASSCRLSLFSVLYGISVYSEVSCSFGTRSPTVVRICVHRCGWPRLEFVRLCNKPRFPEFCSGLGNIALEGTSAVFDKESPAFRLYHSLRMLSSSRC